MNECGRHTELLGLLIQFLATSRNTLTTGLKGSSTPYRKSSTISLFSFSFVCVWKVSCVSLCSPVCLVTNYTDQVGLELTEICPCSPHSTPMLGLKTCAITNFLQLFIQQQIAYLYLTKEVDKPCNTQQHSITYIPPHFVATCGLGVGDTMKCHIQDILNHLLLPVLTLYNT